MGCLHAQEMSVSLLNLQSCCCCSQKQSCSVYHRLAHVGQRFHRRRFRRPLGRGERGRFWLLGDHTTTALVFLFPDHNQDNKAHHHQRCLRRHAWDAQALRMWPTRACEQTETRKEMHAWRCREPARSCPSPASEKVGSEQQALRKAAHDAWTPVSSVSHC